VAMPKMLRGRKLGHGRKQACGNAIVGRVMHAGNPEGLLVY